ncbi:MipA/OmpV family protein [Sphingobium lignivorans]|uniref:Outer membrane scaffolding protein for murein synthesis (MipA/OmpV family) n=1 Tax=Sphingobium lignivorans TaxID=2735886 RepID=A0ABR6NHP5_9SPHN|nr:MipA/OmpV family protein [Sphingobium lignivorans]MBB5986800.1 outer membrane scaffolding protein for murein synthesis (MipA/OmpV family) [Sphingobium lignivorans]
MRLLVSTLLVCGTALSATGVHAQEASPDTPSRGIVAVGAGIVPEYDGASDMRVLPFVTGEIRLGIVSLEMRGQRLRLDLNPGSRLSFGPAIGLRLPRDDADGSVGLLPEIDTAIEAGGFVGYRIGGDRFGQGSVQMDLTVVHDVSDTHKGLIATATASYAAIRNPVFSLSLDAQAGWANADYARTYFGIDEAAAAASGLPAYRPGAGFRDVGAGVTASYWFNRRLGVVARAGASYLIGDLADSPVTQEGSRWQPAAGLALAYRF